MSPKKVCRHCGQVKPAGDFPANPRLRDGVSSWCRDCHAGSVRQWRAEHPERVAVYNRARRVKHQPQLCVVCGELFVPGRSDALVCGKKCRWKRDRELAKNKAA